MTTIEFKRWFGRFVTTTGATLDARQYEMLKQQIGRLGDKTNDNGPSTVADWHGLYVLTDAVTPN